MSHHGATRVRTYVHRAGHDLADGRQLRVETFGTHPGELPRIVRVSTRRSHGSIPGSCSARHPGHHPSLARISQVGPNCMAAGGAGYRLDSGEKWGPSRGGGGVLARVVHRFRPHDVHARAYSKRRRSAKTGRGGPFSGDIGPKLGIASFPRKTG